MNNTGFKEKLKTALAEPPAPEKLVEDTVSRVRTMMCGKKAELQLRESGDKMPWEERAGLIADSVLGRLALSGTLPLGADTAALHSQLMDAPRFQKLADRSVGSVLSGIENGSLMAELTHTAVQPAQTPKPAGPVLGK